MKIYFQGEKGAYSHIASRIIAQKLDLDDDSIIGLPNFGKVWENIGKGSVGILPIENSYAGSIRENMYNFLRYDHKVIGELQFPIIHCLLSKGNDINKIKKAYSHQQALSQCYEFLKGHNIEPIQYLDTASSAKMISENGSDELGAIASKEAGMIYGLNMLKEGIQDQTGNTTRFVVVADSGCEISLSDVPSKTSLIFEARNIPASLYKCLGAFATNSINLTKIESMPNLKDPFSYIFWLDFEGNLKDEKVKLALEELKYFTKNHHIIGEY